VRNRLLAAALTAAAFVALHPGAALAHAVPTTWCGGTSVAATDRKPDSVAGNQINVMYARPLDAPDHFAQLASPIASDIAAIDAWWRQQDPNRTPRFDLYPFTACGSTFGSLDLADVTLPQPAIAYASQASSFSNIVLALENAPFSAVDTHRKYLVYYDAPTSNPDICGTGGGLSNRYTSGPSWAVVYVQSCGITIGDGNFGAWTATHELIHALGAVGAGALHECAPPNNAHVCDSTSDIMYPYLSNSPFDSILLDVGRDDYYGNGGSFDIRNSTWLTHLDLPQFALTVSTTGTGSGHVTANAGGIDCPGTCGTTQTQGTQVTLTAVAASGSRFAGWGGACSGTGACTVTLDAAKNVTAAFALQVPLSISIDSTHGSGAVSSTPAGISCPGTCSMNVDQGQSVTLTAQPGAGFRLDAWGGACSGRDACTVTVDAAKTVSAAFGPASYRVTTQVTGNGSVASAPAGITCPGTCAASFDTDATVTLHAAPLAGHRFVGWGGACTGLGDCTVTVSQDSTVSAIFEALPYRLTGRVSGRGRIVSKPSGIACPGRCAASFLFGSAVRLTAVPASGYRFKGWSGACKGRASCTVRVAAAASVSATFVKR
jgi:hypothetical protein